MTLPACIFSHLTNMSRYILILHKVHMKASFIISNKHCLEIICKYHFAHILLMFVNILSCNEVVYPENILMPI